MAEKKRNYDYYEPITTHDSSLSPCIHSIMAAEIGYREKAYNYFMQTARLDLDDYNSNVKDGIHAAAMAGTWMSIVNGFAGIRALFESAEQFENHRLPELFCGYDRDEGKIIPSPVACSPQAWAAGTPFACVQALLGIQVNGISRTISFHPTLPNNMDWLKVEGMKIGKGCIDLLVTRLADKINLEVKRNTSGYKILDR